MGILATIDKRLRAEDTNYQNPAPWFRDWLVGETGAAGVRVNERNAMTITDVFKCVRVRAETLAVLPKKVYERITFLNRPGRQEAPAHPLYRLLHDAPNPMLTSFRFFEMGSAHIDTWGNWFSYIQRRGARATALWPLQPDRVRIVVSQNQLWYYVSDYSGNEQPFYPDEILHIPGLGYDGVRGYSPVRLMMDALGWAKATEQFGARFFANSARPSALLISESTLPAESKKELLDSFNQFHSGSSNTGRVGLIEGNAKYQPLSIPNDEAQFLESRKYQRSDIAGMYRIPGWMIGDPDPISDNNVEHTSINLVTAAVQPPAERIQQEMERALLFESEKSRYFIEFELKGLLKGDTTTRTAHYKEMFGMGAYSQNKILEEENEAPFEGGDRHWIQLNMVPVEIAEQLLTAKNEPKTAQNDPTQAKNDPMSIENKVRAELQARFRLAYSSVFRDAVGRVLQRKSSDRARVAGSIFRPFLESMGEVFAKTPDKKPDSHFIDRYIASLELRVDTWAEAPETIAWIELDRAVEAFWGDQHGR